MKKTLIALALLAAAVIAAAACTESTGVPAYVEPTMEGFTVAETTSEFFTESALQPAESELATQTEAAASFSAGKPTTTAAITTSTARPVTAATAKPTTTTAKPATAPVPAVPTSATAAQATTTTRYVQPQTAASQTATATTAAPVISTAQYTMGNYEWVGTTQATTTATTTTRPTTMTTTTTTTAAPATTTQAKPDYESMGQAQYQEEIIKALNAMRAEQGLAPMAKSDYLMSACLDQARKMAAAENSFHTDGFPPGFESVSYVPYDFPAKVLAEMLTLHVGNFLDAQSTLVGIAVVRNGNRLYACMQGN